MRPTLRALKLAASWFAFSCAIGLLKLAVDESYGPTLSALWLWSSVALAVLCLYDLLQEKHEAKLTIHRNLPQGFAVGTNNHLSIAVHNRAPVPMRIHILEKVEASVRVHGMPLALSLPPNEHATLKVSVRPTSRGPVVFEGLDVLVESPFRLWAKRRHFLTAQEVKVFPNFTAVSNFELLAHGQISGHLGVHMQQRRGEGTDFHQLREFRPGDALRQVDWKATSRTLKPISREFQDERDQEIIFLLDCGRRMRAKDDELSHFDHCLNAFLLTAYVALRQGDRVGFHTFGGEDKWVSPIKGKNNLNTLLHQIYDLHSTTDTTDYLDVAQKILNRHKKRSLIIFISNVNEQDNDDLLSACTLLSKNHIVILASLQEQSVVETLDKPVQNFMGALSYAGTVEYEQKRNASLAYLASTGTILLDALPSHIHIALVNQYLALKRSGRI